MSLTLDRYQNSTKSATIYLFRDEEKMNTEHRWERNYKRDGGGGTDSAIRHRPWATLSETSPSANNRCWFWGELEAFPLLITVNQKNEDETDEMIAAENVKIYPEDKTSSAAGPVKSPLAAKRSVSRRAFFQYCFVTWRSKSQTAITMTKSIQAHSIPSSEARFDLASAARMCRCHGWQDWESGKMLHFCSRSLSFKFRAHVQRSKDFCFLRVGFQAWSEVVVQEDDGNNSVWDAESSNLMTGKRVWTVCVFSWPESKINRAE